MNFSADGRGNLGGDIPVAVYRLMEYSLKEELEDRFGMGFEQCEHRSAAGYRAGVFFVKNQLDLSQELNAFIAALQSRLAELKIGVLRVERFEENSGKLILTVSEDADCSGLPLLGEAVCNYDEGFISGIMSTYMKRKYSAVEIDCWATGDRVCRFCVEPEE